MSRSVRAGVIATALALGAVTFAPQAAAQVDVNVNGDGSNGLATIIIHAPPSGGGPSASGGGAAPVSNGVGGAVASYGGGTDTPPDFAAILASIVAQNGGALPANQATCFLTTLAACTTPAAQVAPGAPAAPPPPSPAQVAQVAIAELGLRAGAPQLSANPNTAVGLPVWMWVKRSAQTTGPASVTATLGATTVTATAVLSSITWSMGPAGAFLTCNGPGTPAPGRLLYQGDNSPDCGYSYALRSLPERTGGTGRWPVTATSTFAITWTGAGQNGAQTLTLSASTSVEVGELQAVVTGGN
jgi:hypothetical protein